MEQNDIPKILKSLTESRNKVDIITNLSSLRTFVGEKKQFTIVLKLGGIGAVTGCLRKFSNSIQIVTISLSILGNCCIERDCAKEVIKHNGILILSDILKNFVNDSIICRTFRIIGNIAQFDNYASEIHKYKIVPVVVHILNKDNEKNDQTFEEEKENKITMGTKAMAVRVLRILWNSYSNRENMIQDGTIRVVSLILIKYTDKWVKKEYPDSARKEMEKFLDNILKALLIFSKTGTAECAKQILADGNGFKTLVLLIPINPYVTVKCLTNLSHVATSRSDIANTEAVNCIVKRLKDYIHKHPNERCPNDVVSAFCLFFKHPLNCSEVKKAGGLQLILKMLQNCKSKRQEYMMTAALSSVLFDKKEEDILKSNGIIDIAISCIERNLKSKNDLSDKHDYIRRAYNISLKSSEARNKRKYMRDRSPSEESSGSSSPKMFCSYDHVFGRITPPDSDSSPNCSPRNNSPLSEDFDTEMSDDSENYSPLCSDFEDNENMDVVGVDKETNYLESESEKEMETENINTNDVEEKITNMLLSILSRLIYKNKICTVTSIVTKKCMTVLLKCARECKNPSDSKISKLLWNIISDAENLLYIIQNDIIKLIYSLTEKQHDSSCVVCYRLNWTAKKLLTHLSTLAESDLGKISITNILQNGNVEEKLKCVLYVPFIIKFKPLLLKVMESYDGLNVLLTNFEENSAVRYDVTVSLNKLSRSVHLNGPMIRFFFPFKPYHFENKYVCEPSSNNDIVTIKLDDGSTINVDREFLIKQTHYFKVMLTGSFSESNQEVITLKNVSNDALQCLLNLLKIDLQTIVPQPLNVNLLTVLEVLVLADLYLLEKLTDWLSTCVIEYYLTVDTASDIYSWSITSGTNLLRVETVAFILTFKMKDGDRYKLFENILESGLINEIKDDVQSLISRYLKIR